MCLCLRRRGEVSWCRPTADDVHEATPDLPSSELLERQAQRLSALRGRVLRRLGVAHLGPVLDLGAGQGAVTGELLRRSRGPVVALDRRAEALHSSGSFEGALRVAADGKALPFADDSFALVYLQVVLLWDCDPRAVIGEVARVLRPGGVAVAVEPDYGGLIEWPEEIALSALWRAALSRAGADPLVGRKLPGLFHAAGFEVQVDLLSAPSAADADRFELLGELLLTEEERADLERCRKADRELRAAEKLVHLPFLFVTGKKPGRGVGD